MLDGVTCVIIATVVMLVLMLAFKVPVFVSIFAACMSYFILNPNASVGMAAQRITSGVESVSLLACPFFIFAGVLFNSCGITERLMGFADLVTGRIHGGLAQANILLSTIMGGMSGSNNADAAMEAKILIPEMEARGLPRAFSAVITAFSSLITPLIPPGICMILYSTMANISTGEMFTWGLVIGIIMCVTMMMFTAWVSRRRGFKPTREGRMPKGALAHSLARSWPSLMLPVVIIGSIRIGAVTPSEAGAVAVVYAIILGLVYRKMNIKSLAESLKETAVTTGAILLIVSACSMYSWVLTKEQIPQILTNAVLTLVSDKFVFLVVINIFMLIVGMFMEGAAATIILAPLLAPIAAQYGIDAVHFGMIVTVNLSIGVITPPLGTVMYVTCNTCDCKIGDFLKESWPYFLYMLVLLVLVTYVPFVLPGIY